MKTLHTILMIEKTDNWEIEYNNVVGYEVHFGCELVLFLSDGSQVKYDNDKWDMYDLTPTRGWNPKAVNRYQPTRPGGYEGRKETT